MKIELINISPAAEHIIETAARTCYQSADRMTDTSAESLLPRLLQTGHESPFEHAYASFMITGCSRAMTHQLVRHRLLAISQRSQRYVTEKSFDYVVPETIAEEHVADFDADMETIRQMYVKWKERGVRNEDARFVLPNACATEIMISANFREFRHVFRVRCDRHAQWEIRQCCCEMLRILNEKAPLCFKDLAEQFL